jgi:hypothetical protein
MRFRSEHVLLVLCPIAATGHRPLTSVRPVVQCPQRCNTLLSCAQHAQSLTQGHLGSTQYHCITVSKLHKCSCSGAAGKRQHSHE